MAALIQKSIQKLKNQLNSYLNNNLISPFLDFAEHKTHLERSIIALGMFGILVIYLIYGWGNDFVCDLIGILYPIYATLLAIVSKGTNDNDWLLIYWIVYSLLSCIESLGRNLLNSLVFYWLVKCIFLLWFMKSGSMKISRRFVKNTAVLDDPQTELKDCIGTTISKPEDDIDLYHEEILTAIRTGDASRLQDILDELDRLEPSSIKQDVLNMGYQEADGLTALSIAAGKRHKSVTEILATCPEVEVNKASSSGITPLLMVAEVGWSDILDILLQRGATVDYAPFGKRAEDNKIAGSTPLIGATKYNHPECVKLLLAHHANPNHQAQSGISAIMIAAEQGYFDCVKLLVEAGADLELAPSGQLALTLNICGQTALFCAAKEGRTDIVKYLLDRGANPRVQNHYGVSALWIPAQKGMLDVVELLLDAGAETDVAPFGNLADELNITGWTPLYVAMKSQEFDVVKLLLKHGANPNAVTKLGSTPFLLASEICDLDIIEAFVEADADLNFTPSGPDADNSDITGQTALFMATLQDRVDVVKYFIENGAQVNVQNRYGVSPLLLCAESGNYELVQALVEAGADVNITSQGDLAEENCLAGQTPLFGAAKNGHLEICEYLIQNGADVSAVTMTGATLLYIATEEGHSDVVELLIRHGAGVNRSSQD